jgi:hypothetical protein
MSDSKKAYKNWKVQQGSDIIFPNQVWQAACDWKASAQDGVSSSADCILVPRSLIERWANVDAFNVPRGAAMELKVAAQMMLSTQQQPSAVVPEWLPEFSKQMDEQLEKAHDMSGFEPIIMCIAEEVLSKMNVLQQPSAVVPEG